MNADDPTPRVGFAQLKNMIGRRVLFVGRVESMDGGLVRMAAPDGSKVAIQAGGAAFETPYAEVCGTVVDPQTIREESHVNFGENFGAARGRGRARGALWAVSSSAAAAPATRSHCSSSATRQQQRALHPDHTGAASTRGWQSSRRITPCARCVGPHATRPNPRSQAQQPPASAFESHCAQPRCNPPHSFCNTSPNPAPLRHEHLQRVPETRQRPQRQPLHPRLRKATAAAGAAPAAAAPAGSPCMARGGVLGLFMYVAELLVLLPTCNVHEFRPYLLIYKATAGIYKGAIASDSGA